jgi:hypothetical protein
MTNPYETLKTLNETLNKIIVNPNIPANQKGEIILNLTRAIENISKSLPAHIPETKKEEEVKKELENERSENRKATQANSKRSRKP